jgi:hypothetical protein
MRNMGSVEQFCGILITCWNGGAMEEEAEKD